jgi:hypothetical protein
MNRCKEIGLEVNAEKTNYMTTPQDQNAEQNSNIQLVINPMKQWNSLNIWIQQ